VSLSNLHPDHIDLGGVVENQEIFGLGVNAKHSCGRRPLVYPAQNSVAILAAGQTVNLLV
jgi:hypothetical protein